MKSFIFIMTVTTRHRGSTSTRWHFAFGLCCHSNETSAPLSRNVGPKPIKKKITAQNIRCSRLPRRAANKQRDGRRQRQPNSAQPGDAPYHSPKLHPGRCSSVGVRSRTVRHTDARDQYILWVKKTRHYNIVHNFAKCWPIFKLFSLTDSLVNMQQIVIDYLTTP